MALYVCLLMEAGGWVEVGVGVYLCMCAIVQLVGSLHKKVLWKVQEQPVLF
jgi:hypothetical protein